jgi:hypothetical protein
MVMDIDEERIALPGFGQPVNELARWDRHGEQERLPHAIADNFASEGITSRERRMLDFMNQISDKPEWTRKVHDQEIVAKWEKEAVRWDDTFREKGDWWLSQTMFDQCIQELKEKAERYEKEGLVSVLDAEATIVKSDVAVRDDLREALKERVKSLENVPDRLKDWHPGSDGKVLDLVHPSLFPVVYGLSRALPSTTVPLEKCIEYIGKGETIPAFEGGRHLVGSSDGASTYVEKAWGTFQWLPSHIAFSAEGKPIIDSYINNLNPKRHAALYTILEDFVDASIPLWNECISNFQPRIRIELSSTGRADWLIAEGEKFDRERFRPDPEEENYEPTESDEEEENDYYWAINNGADDEYDEWFRTHRILQYPEPVYKTREELQEKSGYRPIDLKKDFRERGIQVIFKLANIHLTPEKPTYDGGSWHVEGSLNEHISATALYYYDSENVTDSKLEFRQSYDNMAMLMKPEQNEHESTEIYYDVHQDGSTILRLGSVLTRPGRLLAFPNVLQHQVQPFELIDKTKPGHRKILAMFLIDPHTPILSTANVPPQRKDWWAHELRKSAPFASLPEELFEMIIDRVEDFPMSWQQAVEAREKLMKERGKVDDEVNQTLESVRNESRAQDKIS